MKNYILVWSDGGYVTIDLSGGSQLLLAFDDAKLATRCGVAMCQQFGPDRQIMTVEVSSARQNLLEKLRDIVTLGDQLANVHVVYPDNPVYLQVVKQILNS